ncbi:hypothetical protein QFC22_003986 [Naganishia vaughanmartiniae]|uniref:Uncharacterized protein n=1 Tax=Naganishia vaughanmartiniae TaxID=1424756 RepID=A0ACC2X412_9TREE|nr:hypothetical protein QFC22_003986 [Naganishia vaughanmartiniae]
MDIDDKQDELLEYEDGDAQMRTDAVDADVILVDEAEGDAEMVDDAELKQDDNDDTPMVDDVDQPAMVEETMVEETEIVMQPAEEEGDGDSDGDTPMREDGDESIIIMEEIAVEAFPTNTAPEETSINIAPPQQSEETVSMSSVSANWPPQPTDVPPVPSLLPSALAVPQDIRHQEGKIHDATHHSSAHGGLVDSPDDKAVDEDAASIIAEPDPAAPHPPATSAAPQAQVTAEKADDTTMLETRSNFVEPAGSVRESDFGGTGMTATAPNSVADDAVEERTNTATSTTPLVPGSAAKWPPAPTEVPAVPSLLPSALAVPDRVDSENGVLSSSGREGKLHAEASGRVGREETESVVAEPAGSVRAAEAATSVRANGNHGGDDEDDASSVFTAKSELGENTAGGTGTKQKDPLPPIIVVVSNTRHQPLFAPLPAGIEYAFPSADSDESGKATSVGWDTSSPILPDLQTDLADAPICELFVALRISLGEEFAETRGKELIIYQEELGLKVGEVSTAFFSRFSIRGWLTSCSCLVQDNKHAEEVTLNDIIRLHTGCGCPQPVVFHLEHDSQRFISRYKAIRKILADAREDDAEAEEVLDGEDGEGETVYIDAYDEDEEDDELAYEDLADHEHHEEEEDELAQDTTADETPDAGRLGAGAVQPVREVTEEILEYEEDEGTASAHLETVTKIVTPVVGRETEAETETDQFGVDAAIRAAEQEATSSSTEVAHQEEQNVLAAEPTKGVMFSTKRPLEEGAEKGGSADGERQVKRKLSPEVEGGDVEA